MKLCWLVVLAACGNARPHNGDDAAIGDAPGGGGRDARSTHDAPGTGGRDAAGHDGGGTHHDGGSGGDAARSGGDASGGGVITGGPCASGMPGATAYRIKWTNGNGTAYVEYEVDGLPDKSRDKAGAYGYQIGFTPSFVDPFLGPGGLQLDGSDFVDLEISTVGIASISNATLSIYGRSFDTTTSGSFNWQTFVDTGQTPTDSVSNVAPYAWYSGDMTTALAPNDSGALIRIKAGPSSGVLVVNQIELCVTAS